MTWQLVFVKKSPRRSQRFRTVSAMAFVIVRRPGFVLSEFINADIVHDHRLATFVAFFSFLARCFVKRSAGFARPLMLLSLARLCRMTSCIHNPLSSPSSHTRTPPPPPPPPSPPLLPFPLIFLESPSYCFPVVNDRRLAVCFCMQRFP